MRQTILLLLSLLIFASCKKTENTLNGFGDLKLGISPQEFEEKFHKKLNLKTGWLYSNSLESEVSNIQINDNINLKDAYLVFYKSRLIYIGSTNKDLYDFLCKNYSVVKKEKVGESIIGSFKTNNKDSYCEFILENDNTFRTLGIFSIGTGAHRQN